MAPERLLADAPPAPLLDRHAERAASTVAHRVPVFDRVLAADPAQFLGKDRAVFDPVPVGVDDRVVEPRFDLRCREMSAQRGPPRVDVTLTQRYRRRRPGATGTSCRFGQGRPATRGGRAETSRLP